MASTLPEQFDSDFLPQKQDVHKKKNKREINKEKQKLAINSSINNFQVMTVDGIITIDQIQQEITKKNEIYRNLQKEFAHTKEQLDSFELGYNVIKKFSNLLSLLVLEAEITVKQVKNDLKELGYLED